MTETPPSIFFTDNPKFDLDPLAEAFAEHLEYSLAKDRLRVTSMDTFKALAMTVRDRLVRNWLRTQNEYANRDAKRVYYLSMEFLMGRLLGNLLINLNQYEECRKILAENGFDLERIREVEHDMGLGNGGLGRLAACYLDSMATLALPAYGYGIRYEFGIFRQSIHDGWQIEEPDPWLQFGCPWEIVRPEHMYRVQFRGRVTTEKQRNGEDQFRWVDTDDVMALAHDIPVPGYQNCTVNNLRLWSAKATQDFNLEYFNNGDYMLAVETKNRSENISKVLYPSDNTPLGKQLRLRQEYFFVSASLQDIIKHYDQRYNSYDAFPDFVALHLNDTHPALAVAELMRLFLDDKRLGWEKSWDLTRRTTAFTNHTILPEALEKWPVEMMEQQLPRHMQIIYEINRRFLDQAAVTLGGDEGALRRLSLIEEDGARQVRMANLAIAGSHTVNGVSALHTQIIKSRIFSDFARLNPGQFRSITNGVSPRRWLRLANPGLSALIASRIGEGWVTNLDELRQLEDHADDPEFRKEWRHVKHENKLALIRHLERRKDIALNADSLFDVHVKRFHEYKRQLLNVLHIITLFNSIRDNPRKDWVSRTVLIGGKAAPAYHTAKLIIKLISSVASVVNNDPHIGTRLKVLFIPNYDVSLAMKIIPAADLSEQISTAGFEASGTGNMKFALNGALTIGTLDGANIEMMEKIGRENMFIFGLTADGVARQREKGYTPAMFYENIPELKRVLDMIASGYFSPDQPDLFQPLFDLLVKKGDFLMLLADYEAYIHAQNHAAAEFKNEEEWTRKAILNVARMGMFSSDRAVAEYARDIWGIEPVPIEIKEPRLDARE